MRKKSGVGNGESSVCNGESGVCNQSGDFTVTHTGNAKKYGRRNVPSVEKKSPTLWDNQSQRVGHAVPMGGTAIASVAMPSAVSAPRQVYTYLVV